MAVADLVWAGQAAAAGWPACGFEQVHPPVLAVPAAGQVHGELAAAVTAVRVAVWIRSRRWVALWALA